VRSDEHLGLLDQRQGNRNRRSNFEAACNKLLEAGYHVAFSSNQDNHCANWGASYTNRTAVLVPNGERADRASFVAALRHGACSRPWTRNRSWC
jgi:hypothetical protein